MFRTGLVVLAVCLLLTSAVFGQETLTPQEVVEAFYADYLAYARDTGNPLVDQMYHTSPYLSTQFVQQVDALVASFDRGGYDPFLQAQDVPPDLRVGQAVIAGDGASVPVSTRWDAAQPEILLTVDLRLDGGMWKITGISAGEAALPQRVTEAFYADYLAYARATGNPLVDQMYHTSPYLSPEFVQQVDALVASFDRGGYDPFLQAQDLPSEILIGQSVVVSDAASVLVQTLWPTGPEATTARSLTVDLQKAGGQWIINRVTDGDAAMAARVTEAFYRWYLDRAAQGSPLADQSYRHSPYLSAALIGQVDELTAGTLVADPFVCAQDIPSDFAVSDSSADENTAVVTWVPLWPTGPDAATPGDALTVTLIRSETNGWQISEIACPR